MLLAGLACSVLLLIAPRTAAQGRLPRIGPGLPSDSSQQNALSPARRPIRWRQFSITVPFKVTALYHADIKS